MLNNFTFLGTLVLISTFSQAQKVTGTSDFPLVENDVLLQAQIATLSLNPQTKQVNVYAWQSLPGTLRLEGQPTGGNPASATYLTIQKFDASGKTSSRFTEAYALSALDAGKKYEHQSSSRTIGGQMLKPTPVSAALNQVATQFPELNLAEKKVLKADLIQDAGGIGMNRTKYRVFPKYTYETTSLNSPAGEFTTQKVDETPQAEVYKQKFIRYMSYGSMDSKLLPVGPDRYQGLAGVFDENDKNSLHRNMRFLNFNEKGELVSEHPVTFKYNREIAASLPVYDAAGKNAGTCYIFGSGPGKKEFQDPVDNNFNVLVFDEKGEPWSTFDFQNGSGSMRAVLANHVMRKDDKLYLINTNQQKLLKPLYETWVFDKSGQKTLLNSLSWGDLSKASKPVGTVNGGNELGWFDNYRSEYCDSFVDKNGDLFLLLQRRAEETVSAPRAPGESILGRPAVPAKIFYNDLFVLQFDSGLKLKTQTVLGRGRSGNPTRVDRIRREGDLTQYVLSDSGNEVLTIRGSEAKLQRINPADAAIPAVVSGKNYIFDPAVGTLYAVYTLPKVQEPNRARLVTVKMD